jgi:hypothetical protein
MVWPYSRRCQKRYLQRSATARRRSSKNDGAAPSFLLGTAIAAAPSFLPVPAAVAETIGKLYNLQSLAKFMVQHFRAAALEKGPIYAAVPR